MARKISIKNTSGEILHPVTDAAYVEGLSDAVEPIVAAEVSKIVGGAPEAVDTLEELAAALEAHKGDAAGMIEAAVSGKANSADVYTKAVIDEKLLAIDVADQLVDYVNADALAKSVGLVAEIKGATNCTYKFYKRVRVNEEGIKYLDEADYIEDSTLWVPRDGETGIAASNGSGQLNILVEAPEGYEVSVNVKGIYKNLKTPIDTGVAGLYRLTGVAEPLNISLAAKDPNAAVDGWKVHFDIENCELLPMSADDVIELDGHDELGDFFYTRMSTGGDPSKNAKCQARFKLVAKDGYELPNISDFIVEGTFKSTEVEGDVYKFKQVASDLKITAAAVAIERSLSYYNIKDAYTKDEVDAKLCACPAPISTAEALQEALNASGSVKLAADVVGNFVVPEGVEVVLDLGSYKITNNLDHTITVNGKLTICGNGIIDNLTHAKAPIVINESGVVVLQSGTITRSLENGQSATNNGGNSYYAVLNHGKFYMYGGRIIFTGLFSSLIENGFYDINDAGLIEYDYQCPQAYIYGGVLDGGKNTIKNDFYGILEVYGGVIGINCNSCAILNWHKCSIYGGVVGTGENGHSVETGTYYGSPEIDAGRTNIYGGTFLGEFAWKGNYEVKGTYRATYNKFGLYAE